MLEDIYSVYLPKKAHPWCYISLDINPQNIDVNIHPTKHEVRFLHEDAILERIKLALDEKLAGNNASRSFYLQARLPKADITKEVLEEVLPEYNKGDSDKSKKIHAREMIRTDSSDQKLDKFNFTIHSALKHGRNDSNISTEHSTHSPELDSLETPLENVPDVTMKDLSDDKCQEKDLNLNNSTVSHVNDIPIDNTSTHWSDIIDTGTSVASNSQEICNPSTSAQNDKSENIDAENTEFDISEFLNDSDKTMDNPVEDKCIDVIADRARKQVYQYFGTKDIDNIRKRSDKEKNEVAKNTESDKKDDEDSIFNTHQSENILPLEKELSQSSDRSSAKSAEQFKSYSVNNFRHEVKLTSILKLRKEVEDECHEGLRNILANLTFVGCIDQTSALIQSGVNLYICNTRKLA